MLNFCQNNLEIIILAAGQGKRMHSKLPKVLHTLAGIPLLQHVLSTAEKLSAGKIHIVYGHGGEAVINAVQHEKINWVKQEEQLGTAHAVMQAMPFVGKSSQVLILFGDVPLISHTTLEQLLVSVPKHGAAILTAFFDDPTGFGRILRNDNNEITAIVEEKDATPEQQKIKEINTGMLVAPASVLNDYLPKINKKNAQKEYYLTHLPELLVNDNKIINWITTHTIEEVQGVNNKKQLAELERFYQQKLVNNLMIQGVTVKDPNRLDIRGTVETGMDVAIDINVILEGQISIGTDTMIGANTVLRNVRIGERVIIKENCVIEDCVIDDDCIVGPFARIRPETHLQSGAHVGNFVEVKKSTIGKSSKVCHLSYIGDCTIGKNVNIGAGTITCNYDGANKHPTVIEDEVFIGSGTELVAPVRIEQGATVGAGSTVTRDAPANQLTVARARQCSITGWRRPEKLDEEN